MDALDLDRWWKLVELASTTQPYCLHHASRALWLQDVVGDRRVPSFSAPVRAPDRLNYAHTG